MLLRTFVFLLITFTLLLSPSCNSRKKDSSKAKKSDSTLLTSAERAALEELRSDLEELKTNNCFRGAVIGYQIIDFTKGFPKILFESNSRLGMIPASAQKIITTAAALEIFGTSVHHDVFLTNLNSVNWRANRLLKKIGEYRYKKNSFFFGSRAVTEFWQEKGVDVSGLYLCDGSGKSRNNIVSPKQLTDVLYTITSSTIFPVFYNSLPLAGISGTMHKWLNGTVGQGRIRAKTGSLAGVRSYTGYVRTVSGKKLIFAIIVNNYSCPTKKLKQRLEKTMVKMVEL